MNVVFNTSKRRNQGELLIENAKTIWVQLKERVIKRHKIKHAVDLPFTPVMVRKKEEDANGI